MQYKVVMWGGERGEGKLFNLKGRVFFHVFFAAGGIV